ncbi:phosphate ABC transporter permease PstA [Geoalkalibacter sp.]|uniref:phosphate ABC transporter permease PstA n=1 Tax=Geoalkalibacter sp. TaxID=3041440 RepID=UPI00272EA153|nr:phosphate ABC transporter permease PstA [Geoalkalibacter sp.]
MNSSKSSTVATPLAQSRVAERVRTGYRTKTRTALAAHGQPYVWLAGGMLALSLAMILGLLTLILVRGTGTFWPAPVIQVEMVDGRIHMGEITRHSSYVPREELLLALPAQAMGAARALLAAQDGVSERFLIRTGNFELTQEHFNWVSDFAINSTSYPQWALLFERQEWGRFYGMPEAFLIDGERVATTPAEVWGKLNEHHRDVRRRWQERRALETHEIGKINYALEQARLQVRGAELAVEAAEGRDGKGSPAQQKALLHLGAAQAGLAQLSVEADAEYGRLRGEINRINQENARFEILVTTADGRERALPLAQIVRAYTPNQLSLGEKFGIYFDRWLEFLRDDPREANSEGGVFPAIFGTVVMTLIMSICVVPFGVLAALYLREYAKAGPMISTVRIAVNNLAGVPSIVFGVFGLGFFCYLMGGTIDQLFYSAKLPSPTFGTGGILWASLTLALLTLPVVIVATEESLAAVPSSMREGSYACGASKWQTIRRIVLPRAMPGIMTGMILAMARGAGEVAPLMLVGAVKLAPELPVDGYAPFVHLERSFMHLGFHIFDLGFQSQNSEAAVPMVFSTTLLLVAIIALLNIGAILLRNRLRRKFMTSQF